MLVLVAGTSIAPQRIRSSWVGPAVVSNTPLGQSGSRKRQSGRGGVLSGPNTYWSKETQQQAARGSAGRAGRGQGPPSAMTYIYFTDRL